MATLVYNIKNIFKNIIKLVFHNTIKKPITSVKKSFFKWWVRLTVWEETRNYCTADFTKFLFIVFYIMINFGFVLGQVICNIFFFLFKRYLVCCCFKYFILILVVGCKSRRNDVKRELRSYSTSYCQVFDKFVIHFL
jgi:hypothetical protein